MISLLHPPVPNTIVIETFPLSWIRSSPLNPRATYDATGLEELATSLRQLGMIEPIIVRRLPAGSGPFHTDFEIVAGERRWRAAKIAEMGAVPVRNLGSIDDATALRIMLVENLQRSDLNPIEEAEGYARLNRIAHMSQAEIGAAVHRTQPTIANRMRLLDLPADVRELISTGKLSASHGIALAKHKEYPSIASAIAAWAVTNNASSARLELDPDQSIVEVLKTQKLLREPDAYGTAFDISVCKACPFDAYRVKWGWRSVCLKPSHYDELQAIAVAERSKQDAARLARQKEREAANPMTVAYKPVFKPTVDPPDPANFADGTIVRDVAEGLEQKAVDAQAAIAEGAPLLSSLAYGSFERPDHRGYVNDERETGSVAGCTEECPCRSYAREYTGGPLIPICLDLARFRLLKRRQTIAANKARRKHADALLKSVATTIEALGGIGAAELAVLGTQVLHQNVRADRVKTAWHDLTGTKEQPTFHGNGAGVDALYQRATGQIGGTLLLSAEVVGAVLCAEVKLYHEGYADAPLTNWYLLQKGAKPIDTAAIATEAQAEAATEDVTDAIRCEQCGESPKADNPIAQMVDDNGDEYWVCRRCAEDEEQGDDNGE